MNSQKKIDNVEGVLCDIDGVIWDGQDQKKPTEGAHETIGYIKEELGLPMRFVTNTTTRSLEILYNDIREREYPIAKEEIVSPPVLAAEWLRKKGKPRVFLVMREATHSEFAEFPKDDKNPDYVVIGNYGEGWDYKLINRVYHMLADGAGLLALHRQRFWHTGGEIKVDIGCFVAGLEYAADIEATAIGKPEKLFFTSALERIGVAPERAIMIGDDIESDIGGAQDAGLRGVLVRTGKFREKIVSRSSVEPYRTVDSLVAVRELL